MGPWPTELAMIDDPDKTDRLRNGSLTSAGNQAVAEHQKRSYQTIARSCDSGQVYGDKGLIHGRRRGDRLRAGYRWTGHQNPLHSVYNPSHLRQAILGIATNRGLSATSRQKTQTTGRARLLTPTPGACTILSTVIRSG